MLQSYHWIIFWISIFITTWVLFFAFISKKTQNIALGLEFINIVILLFFLCDGGYLFIGPLSLILRYVHECIWGRFWYYFHYPFLRKLIKNNKNAKVAYLERCFSDIAEYIRYCLKEGDTCFIVTSENKITSVPLSDKSAIWDWLKNQKFEYLVYTERNEKNELTINLETIKK